LLWLNGGLVAGDIGDDPAVADTLDFSFEARSVGEVNDIGMGTRSSQSHEEKE
jgi:hypothetical protein